MASPREMRRREMLARRLGEIVRANQEKVSGWEKENVGRA